MKIVYMGTPDFAVGPLAALRDAGHEILAVVTQPDKEKGRGKEMQACAVKEYAITKGIPVFQPVRIKTAEAVESLKKYEADIYIVAAFGQILSKEILEIPKYGCLNIHASLLPKYRGAAPIQWSILMGEKQSGVTIMQMDVGLDTGDMLLKEVVPIEKKETGQTLHDKLMAAGARLIVLSLAKIEAGTIQREKQKDEESCYASMLSKEMGRILWEKEAVEIERLIRGLNPWPSAYTYYEGKTLKIWEASVLEKSYLEALGEQEQMQLLDAIPGSIILCNKDSIYVATGKGILCVTSVQLEGKKKMSVHDFMLGKQFLPGQILQNTK